MPNLRTAARAATGLAILVVTACATTPTDPPAATSSGAGSSTVPVGAPSAQARPTAFRLAAAGDIACQPPFTVRPRSCHQAATAGLIKRRHVDGVLALGDTQYQSGRLRHYQASYAHSWGAFRAKTLPVAGNHEYRTSGAAGYFRYFGARAHGPRGWYAVNRGSWRIYVLNTNCSFVSCTRERQWLTQDLNRHPHTCSLAAMHHPRFSSGAHGPSPDARRFWPTLDRYQVDLALAGHDHGYERFAPMHVDGTVNHAGIRSFVVGTGGEDLRPLGPTTHGSRYRFGNGFGALFLSLDAGRYSWEFRTANGTVRDRGSAACIR